MESKTSMTYDAIHQGFHSRDKSHGKSRNCKIVVQVGTVSIVKNHTHGEIAQHMVRNAKNVAKTTALKLCKSSNANSDKCD